MSFARSKAFTNQVGHYLLKGFKACKMNFYYLLICQYSHFIVLYKCMSILNLILMLTDYDFKRQTNLLDEGFHLQLSPDSMDHSDLVFLGNSMKSALISSSHGTYVNLLKKIEKREQTTFLKGEYNKQKEKKQMSFIIYTLLMVL